MKPRLSWMLAACVAGFLAYQIASDSGPAREVEPGLNPGGGGVSPIPAEDLSAHRSSSDEAAPRGEIRAKVSGTVRDHLGSPRAGERIWILRPGERHPDVLGRAKKLLTVESDKNGEFQVDLGPEDEWHFSVGPIGESLLTTEVRRFQDGEEARAEIVLDGAAHLSVEVHAGPGVATAVRPARIEILRKTQKGDDRLIPFGAPPQPGFGLDPKNKPEPPVPWATSAALGLQLGEPVLFSRLQVGDTYRVALVLGEETVTSNQNIILKPGEDRIARCSLSQEGEELRLAVALENAPGDSTGAAGFHWKP